MNGRASSRRSSGSGALEGAREARGVDEVAAADAHAQVAESPCPHRRGLLFPGVRVESLPALEVVGLEHGELYVASAAP